MKILYITTDIQDYLSDCILYGLRQKFGNDVVDTPRKSVMYKDDTTPADEIYGKGFTLYKTLDNSDRPNDDTAKLMLEDYFDLVIFSDIYHQQPLFAHFVVYEYFKKTKAKFVFLDGRDDGFPITYDAIHYGTYFKRDNPHKYKNVNIIGLGIPAMRLLKDKPNKSRLFTSHVQCIPAYEIKHIREYCTNKPVFTTQADYYGDLTASKYGVTMKKSGWDTPRNMENAAHWVVNCIYTPGWEWNQETWYQKPKDTHPKDLVDMKNCILWDNPQMLVDKIRKIETEGLYDEIQAGSRKWVESKTCEAMADYMLSKIK